MARREYTHSPQCVHEGCPERANYYFDTRDDQRRQIKHLERVGGWRCVRHTRPSEVLALDNLQREVIWESHEVSYGRFWNEQGKTKGGNGFARGPGFKAFAEDFPAGTRLIVTAQIELPDVEDVQRESARRDPRGLGDGCGR